MSSTSISMEYASCQFSGALNFDVVPGFLEIWLSTRLMYRLWGHKCIDVDLVASHLVTQIISPGMTTVRPKHVAGKQKHSSDLHFPSTQ